MSRLCHNLFPLVLDSVQLEGVLLLIFLFCFFTNVKKRKEVKTLFSVLKVEITRGLYYSQIPEE